MRRHNCEEAILLPLQLRHITVVERFGTNSVIYEKPDEDHFIVTASVDVSEQFFGWLLGFGRRMKLLGPPAVVEKFTEYMDKIRDMY